MKLSLGVASLAFSTLFLLGLIYVGIEKISDLEMEEKKVHSSAFMEKKLEKTSLSKEKEAPRKYISLEEQALKNNDETIIRNLASLSDDSLKEEFSLMAERIKKENLYGALQAKKLSANEAQEAKEHLERFTLLSLESTRRKYMDIEPELKNPIFAHRDSLKDIRTLLSSY